MSKPEPLKGKGIPIYNSKADSILLHFIQEDVLKAVEWLKDAINSDILLKSGLTPESERLLFERIDEAFPDVFAEKKREETEDTDD